MKTSLCLLIILGLFTHFTSSQLQYEGFIQTRKLFLFGPDNGFEFAQFGTTHNFLFERQFDNVPRVGLAVYTLDFEYSPDFSCRITADTNRTATAIRVSSFSMNQNNRIYIMYIATDNQQIGIFVPDRMYTDWLSLPIRTQYAQLFDFNFKEEISALASSPSDIFLTVYLTGASTTSEMTTNGFPTNRTSLALSTSHISTRFYTITVQIGQQYPNILVDWVECTVVYFIPSVLQQQSRYLINSGRVTLKAYGGRRQPTRESVNLLPLSSSQRFQNLKFFFGISRIESKDGASITLLGVQKYYTTAQSNQIRLLLQMQTWRLTYIDTSSFNYLQYKSLKCSQPGANCPEVCSEGSRPFFILNGICDYCHYSCLTCNVSNSQDRCDSCETQTRVINPINNLCECRMGFYETFENFSCVSCFPCGTCQRQGVCLTCLADQNMILNSVTTQCECKQGYYPNLIAGDLYNQTTPCLQCSKNCLYCLNLTTCLACSANSYLTSGECIPICTSDQQFNSATKTCSIFVGNDNQFQQLGRLGFDWSYRIEENQMIIDLIFSQTDLAYYYFENGKGYTYDEYLQQLRNGGGSAGSGDGSGSVFYDDGVYSFGYGEGASGSGAGQGTDQGGSTQVDESALRGEYYGFGEQGFFQRLYANQSISYLDDYGIPYGKYRLSNQPAIAFPNFVDALSRNLVFKLSDQVIPYTMTPVSNNRFTLRTRPSQTYLNALGTIQIKNQALVRNNLTALQVSSVSKDVDRFNYYTSSQLNTAYNLRDSNQVLVDILWGICKYPLFVGFGWPFIPIMLTLQYIMSFNYINTQTLPLNLDYFLASFRDFRNPSIFYNPLRNQIDQDVVSHGNIYQRNQQLEEFDRGLDFMKNSFQFFFIPFLALLLLGLLYLLNLLFRKCCKRDFCLISKFLVPRLPLLIAAYTLVQALPVSFFFFSQLKDVTLRHPNQPTAAYPTFNLAMAFLAFFLTCAIPILLLAWLYYHFNYGSRINEFSDANVFNRKFLNKIQNKQNGGTLSRAHLHDPLWGGDHAKTKTYIFGIAIFFLAIVFGFFLAFFITNFAWQMVGLILFTTLFLVFIIAAGFFKNKVFKIFFIVMTLLMLAYLFLHAGIGSNRAIGDYDQWNTGYLGIGILYALLLTAILFTGYLLYKMIKEMYQNHKKYGCWTDLTKKNQELGDQRKQAQRVTEYRRDTKLKSTFLKSGAPSALGTAAGIGAGGAGLGIMSGYAQNNLVSNVKRFSQPEEQNIYSQDRMIVRNYNQNAQQLQELTYRQADPYKKQHIFVSRDRNMLFAFPLLIGERLLQRQPLFIDSQNRVYDKNRQFIDDYFNLAKEQKVSGQMYLPQQGSRREVIVSRQEIMEPVINTQKTINIQRQIYVLNGEEFEKVGQQVNGQVPLRNRNTGEVKLFDLTNFKKTGQSRSQFVSTSYIRDGQINYDTQTPILYGDKEYINLGYDPSSKSFKLLNVQNQQYQKVPIQKFIQMNQQSLTKRLRVDGQVYDYEGTDQNGIVYLVNVQNPDERIKLSQSDYERFKDQNARSFKQAMQLELNQASERNFLVIDGEQYEELGMDGQGRHRLFNIKTKQYLLLSDDQYRKMTNLRESKGKSSDNLLLLQSAVGGIKRQTDNGRMHSADVNEFATGDVRRSQKVLGQQRQVIELPEQKYPNYQSNVQSREQVLEEEQVDADDVINPNRYYALIGVPAQKAENYSYRPKDVLLRQQGVRGDIVLGKVDAIREKYPDLAVLVKGQDQDQEFWFK